MSPITIQTLGRKLLEARGERGIRLVAKEIGVSPATLSRVERGYMPDLDTFAKICRWLQVDPGDVLGIRGANRQQSSPEATVHFRKDQAIKPEAAAALAQLILAAQRALRATERPGG
jgi:transcriptional regulator with XRE-family HTH domain